MRLSNCRSSPSNALNLHLIFLLTMEFSFFKNQVCLESVSAKCEKKNHLRGIPFQSNVCHSKLLINHSLSLV